jgi:hypothetical protein
MSATNPNNNYNSEEENTDFFDPEEEIQITQLKA